MQIVLMEFSNGDVTEAEAFKDIDSLLKWFREEYFEGYSGANEAYRGVVNQIIEQLPSSVIDVMETGHSLFTAKIYTKYELN